MQTGDSIPKKRGRGRPKKTELESKKPGGRGKVGRPKGDAAILNDYKAMMLASPSSEKIIQTIAKAALDDEHKHQAVAWRIWTDRVLPVSSFEKDAKASGRTSVTVNINAVAGPSPEVDVTGEAIDGDWEDVE